ncbi:MAG: lipid II flippase MurJ [Gemmatimonadales bacterium]
MTSAAVPAWLPHVRRGVALSLLAALNVLLLIVWQWKVLTQLGPGRDMDALVAGMVLPNFATAVVGGSLVNVLLPMLSAAPMAERSRMRAELSATLLALFAGVAAVLALLAPWWVPLIAPGLMGQDRDAVVQLARIQLVGLALSGVLTVQSVARQAEGSFVRVEAAQVAASLGGLAALVWAAPRFGATGVAVSAVLRVVLQLCLLLSTPRAGGRLVPQSDTLRELWRRVRPLLGASLYYKSDVVLDRLLASLAPAGALSLYHVALQIISSGQQVIQRAIVAPAIRDMSAARATDGDVALRIRLRRSLTVVLLLSALATVVLVAMGYPLLLGVFGRGAVRPEQVRMLWVLLLLLTGVWLGGVAGLLLSSSFYVLGDTFTPARIGVIGFTLAIGLKLVAFRAFGLPGLAAAASAYYFMNAGLIGVALGRRLRGARVET